MSREYLEGLEAARDDYSLSSDNPYSGATGTVEQYQDWLRGFREGMDN